MSSTSEKPSVKYVRLGKSGLRVSVPIVGCMSFGTSELAPWVLNEDKALPILKAAWDRGVNTLDTANGYCNGESERIIGKFMKTYNIPREKLVIMTKCWQIVGEQLTLPAFAQPHLADTRDYVNQSRLSRAAIFNQVEKSLERLGTSYIDLLQIHRFDPNTTPEETMCALNDLVRSGKVRYIGASSMWTWQFAEYNNVAEKHGWTQFVSMQNHYNLLDREEEREMIPYCLHKGIGLVPYAPLAQGFLARPLATETLRSTNLFVKQVITNADKETINRVEALAKKYNVSMAQIAIAWTLTKISSPIIGINSPERLEDAIVGDLKLTPGEIKSLEEPYTVKKVTRHV
ncbi:hypothetical protein FRB94_012545 [Tulasnella sp. JGI-2019a]|nr:hypothetical protein FRB93_010157 [Tulasnella sp. JGI-2019a]KAG8991392.1 hypothetical protein FRB94_012545 [Tulasnella sp. JGI-2019a]KAG9035700.1 hypothetical protein FRB95_010765 [Tulasnella sp. JGI-2019a]